MKGSEGMNMDPRSLSLFDAFDMLDEIDTKTEEIKSDIYKQDGIYHIEMDVPGINKENISIETNKGYLKVTVERKTENEEVSSFIKKERTYGKFQRIFYLGEIDDNNIKATIKNGVLKIDIPTQDINTTKKQIEIED